MKESSWILICFILLLFEGRAKALIDVRNLKMTAARAQDRSFVLHQNCLRDGSYSIENFKNKDNVIVCEDTDTVIINKLKLNTAKRTTGNEFSFARDSTEDDKNTWVEVKKSGSHKNEGSLLPLTGCLNNEQGDGGMLSGSFAKTFGKTGTLDLPLAFDIGSMLSGLLDYEFDISSSLTITAQYSCTISANKTGQIFVQPYYMEVDNPEIRYITITEGRTWTNPLSIQAKALSLSNWESVGSKVRINSFSSKPLFSCVTDPDLLDCDGEILGDNFTY
ncbi:uncharacterized protein PRCAT00004946001 [Priceomyces carsonii]|uniref:uncharacterized protein n=1 Tax=Priceomyces carsonii TaxID=28549 RepID=UPI002ED77377|nr:unnamed protein product [Priceomyces carsonii]